MTHMSTYGTLVCVFLCPKGRKAMKDRDFKRRIAYEVLIILGVLALLLFVCRLWPILLLVILGIFVAAIRLLFLSQTKVEVIQPMPPPTPKDPTEKDVQNMAYNVIQRKITELVTEAYPQARWVWQSSHSKEQILAGEDTKILLNHAGGYREAVIHVQNLRVIGLTYVQAEDADRPASPPAEPENLPVEPEKLPVEPEKPCEEPEDPSELPAPNYGLLAFEWVENHAVELNERCNEYIAQKQDFLLLTPSELPERDSWLDICQELSRNGMENCECTEEGIQINLTQGSCRKE